MRSWNQRRRPCLHRRLWAFRLMQHVNLPFGQLRFLDGKHQEPRIETKNKIWGTKLRFWKCYYSDRWLRFGWIGKLSRIGPCFITNTSLQRRGSKCVPNNARFHNSGCRGLRFDVPLIWYWSKKTGRAVVEFQVVAAKETWSIGIANIPFDGDQAMRWSWPYESW